MNVWPLQFRKQAEDKFLFSDDAGSFFRTDNAFLERYVFDKLVSNDFDFLQKNGHSYTTNDDISFLSFATRWIERINATKVLSYVILVPTLRCNLSCDYCQVSRVAENARGFDWDEEKLSEILELLSELTTSEVKIEFQGGEPLLRVDLLLAVRDFCRRKFTNAEFVVCTNLQCVSEEAWDFLDAEDTHVSTSLDGTMELHKRHRTKHGKLHSEFSTNLSRALAMRGSKKISALPTIDPFEPPDPKEVIEQFAELGINSIFLRRVNYQGFARKKYEFEESSGHWFNYYRLFINQLIKYNQNNDKMMEEYYFSLLLNRIFQRGHDGHVDIRNPNWLATDYLVIDFDGKIYPSDEARMISRIGQIDLSIGSSSQGINREKVDALNLNVSNFDDPDCIHCAYRPFCGLDIVDDLSRYGRVDVPRSLTDHCQNHMFLFDYAFELIYSEDPIVHRSLGHWLDIPNYNPAVAPIHA